jgi:hypothetical protein
MIVSSCIPVWLLRPQNDEFIALVKQWTKDELANDDFFAKVGPPPWSP